MSVIDLEYIGSHEKAKAQEPYDEKIYADDGLLINSTTKSIGIRKIEFLNQQYHSWRLKLCLLISCFLAAYCYSLDGIIRYQFQAYATDSYSHHSLLATVNVIRSVVGAASQPTYARLSDRFGRLELIIISILFYAVGTVIESQAYDVQRFAGGAVLYQIGYSGIIILLEIILADFSTLEYRLYYSFIPATPFIINTWISGEVTNSLYPSHSWNYCIGIWAFIFPLSCVPLLLCFTHMLVKARRTNEWKVLQEEANTGKKWFTLKADESMLVALFWELDVIGILFLICVFGFILVPLTIAQGTNSNSYTWAKASTIVPLLIGLVLIPFFILWEAKFSKFPIMPFKLMEDRGVWSALMIGLLLNCIWYMPNDFMYTVLVVGMNTSTKAATRITSLYSFVSVIAGSLLGLFIGYNQYIFKFLNKIGIPSIKEIKKLKGFILFGCLCWTASLGILIKYRGTNDGVNAEYVKHGIIGGLCLMGFGAGFFTYPTQVSIATCTNHEYMAIVISLYLAAYNIGSALGTSVSGAVWTNLMLLEIEGQLAKRKFGPETASYAYSRPFQFAEEYEWGSPARVAVAFAYGTVQRILCIVGVCLCIPLLVFTFFLRDHKLEKVQSLEFDHSPEAGIRDEQGQVVVNNYDDDACVKLFMGIYGRKKN